MLKSRAYDTTKKAEGTAPAPAPRIGDGGRAFYLKVGGEKVLRVQMPMIANRLSLLLVLETRIEGFPNERPRVGLSSYHGYI